jgi:dipeptidyl aminopeptidase B
VSIVDAETQTSQLVRSLNFKDIDGGWFEVIRTTEFVPKDSSKGREEDGYIDTVIVDGYNHLAYFSPIESSEPKQILTQGKWEVDGQVNFDPNTNTVYYLSTETSPVERHLYSVNLLEGTASKQAITNVTEEGYYSVSFSARARYLVLSYQGPDVPWQKVVDLYQDDPLQNAETIVDNAKLRKTLSTYDLPKVVYSQLQVDTDKNGDPIFVNVKEILPPGFYEHGSEKYPVLFAPYGGPASQQTGKTYSIQFEHTLAAEHNVIVVVLDGRGTGFMGREFRCSVRDNLGELEAYDQIQGAKAWAKRAYVDEDHIAIWGWSYGGYLTLKTLEQDAGETFSYGMAVAPVTNWRLYDSIYTERYMHTPQHNAAGYESAAVRNVTAIGQSERFLLIHGTGDDNVHFQNSLIFLDKLDENNVENYDVHVFPDSDHSINYHNANKIVYDKLKDWIVLAFGDKFKGFN